MKKLIILLILFILNITTSNAGNFSIDTKLSSEKQNQLKKESLKLFLKLNNKLIKLEDGNKIEMIKSIKQKINNILSVNNNESTKYSFLYLDYLLNNKLDTLIVNQKIQNTTSGSLNGWMVLDTNCDIPDIIVGSQIWAGCNSTLGNGFEWGKKDDGTNGTIRSCYDYNVNNTGSCEIGSIAMASNTKANTWYTGTNEQGDQEYPTIWGKLYTWNNAVNACPIGRHLPSDSEFETLETTLNGGKNCKNDSNRLQCLGWMGWGYHNKKTDTNNLSNRLKIPLAGNRDSDGMTFDSRGNFAVLWSSSEYNNTTIYTRSLGAGNPTVNRNNFFDKNSGFSVRCIKD